MTDLRIIRDEPLEPDLEKLAEALATAMAAEFRFFEADRDSWMRAARGVVVKMNVTAFKRDENPSIPCYWLKEAT